nr:hypothetical protein [Tanacetum cinerariifolium]
MGITKLKQRVKKLERRNKGRTIAEMDQDANVVLEENKDIADDNVKMIKMLILMRVYMIRGGKQNPKQRSTRLTWNMLIRITAAPKRRKKEVVIKDPKESTTSTIILAETKSKDKCKGILDEVIDHVHKKAKEDNAVKRYQAIKRKPQTEAHARKNILIYLKNVAGFKMDYFKEMSYDDICPIFEAKFNTNVAFLQKTKE